MLGKLIMYLVIALTVFCACSSVSAQEQEFVLENSDVIEMVKAGLSEEVVASKIKSSKTRFDTSAAQLVKLKEGGVSDTLVMVMIETGTKSSQSTISEVTSSEVVFELKEGIGKRRVFVESSDERSRMEIIKVLKKDGFTVVSDASGADLILKFGFSINRIGIGYSPGLFGGVSMDTTAEQQNGKFTIFVKKEDKEHLIFIRERRASTIGKILHKQAKDFTEAFIKELKRVESQERKISK